MRALRLAMGNLFVREITCDVVDVMRWDGEEEIFVKREKSVAGKKLFLNLRLSES